MEEAIAPLAPPLVYATDFGFYFADIIVVYYYNYTIYLKLLNIIQYTMCKYYHSGKSYIR
jgi:hypothetical protein